MGLFDRLDRRLDKLADQLGELIGPDDVRAHLELGQAYLTAGNLEGASRELSAALDLKPDHPRATWLLGLVHDKRGDVTGARELYERSAAKIDFVEPQLSLGQLALTDGRLDEAAESFRRALDAGPADLDQRAEAYRGLGTAHLRAGRYDRAVRELRKAVATAPDDPTAQTLLGRALLGKGDLDTARICLERATRKEPAPPEAWAARGEVLLALGRGDDAEQSFRAALAGISASPDRTAYRDAEVRARLGLARRLRAMKLVDASRDEVLQALALDPGNLSLLVELGLIAAEARSPEVALDAFDRALHPGATDAKALFDPRPLLETALEIALRAELMERAIGYADALREREPSHAVARAALAQAALRRDDIDGALSLLDGIDARSIEVHLARAALAQRRDDRGLALAELRRAALLDPDDARPRDRYAALYARPVPPAEDIPALLVAAHRLAAASPELADLAPRLGRLRESLDRPLIVTVMGEFNAGKSTFVNAFLGEEVAPMGVTPTTATVNLLKYGAERKGRVTYLDERTREIPWNEVAGFLKNLKAAEAKQIRLVELLYPLETLQRIHVVDTPGLNSIHAEHEEVARRFIEEADAVIWLFSIDQAAKASEGEALGKIAAHGRKVLGVLNKIDRADESEREQIIRHVTQSVGQHLEAIVPVSARAALAARKTHDAAALASSNYPTLDATLETRFFSRSREMKRHIAVTRLHALLGEARAEVTTLAAPLDTSVHDRALAAARADQLAFASLFLPAERRQLLESADEALSACAREVLDFVRPRRGLFGGNEATPADRDFLLSLLEERVAVALDASCARVGSELARSATLLAGLPGEGKPAMTVRVAPVFERFRAFLRGYLRGGAVAQFFAKELPRLELVESEVRRALDRMAPLDDETMEEELRVPLRLAGGAFFSQLLAAIAQKKASVALQKFELACRLADPLEKLHMATASASSFSSSLPPSPSSSTETENREPRTEK